MPSVAEEKLDISTLLQKKLVPPPLISKIWPWQTFSAPSALAVKLPIWTLSYEYIKAA